MMTPESTKKAIIRTIGIRGTHPGCGKDTVADMIADKLSGARIGALWPSMLNDGQRGLFARTDEHGNSKLYGMLLSERYAEIKKVFGCEHMKDSELLQSISSAMKNMYLVKSMNVEQTVVREIHVIAEEKLASMDDADVVLTGMTEAGDVRAGTADAARYTNANVVRAKFATPIRECIEAITGVSVAESETVEGKNRMLPEFGMTVGQFLPHFGTDVVRNHVGNIDVWVNALMRRFRSDDFVVISDVRMANEQNAVKKRDGVVVFVTSTRQASNIARLMAGRSVSHATERDLDGVEPDYVIDNDGTLEELSAKVDELLAKLAF